MKTETKTPETKTELKPSDSYIYSNRGTNSQGYNMLYVKDYKFIGKTKIVREHRYNVEIANNKFLTSTQNVHHMNEIKTDNRLENLMIFKDICDHRRFHGIGKTEYLKYDENKFEWYYSDSDIPRYCKQCGRLLTGMQRFIDIYCSKKCAKSAVKSLLKPSKEKLIKYINLYSTPKNIATRLNVKSTIVINWAKSYDIEGLLILKSHKNKCPNLDYFLAKAKLAQNNYDLGKLLGATSPTIKSWWNKFGLIGTDYYLKDKVRKNFLAKAKLCRTHPELGKLLGLSRQCVGVYWYNYKLKSSDYYIK